MRRHRSVERPDVSPRLEPELTNEYRDLIATALSIPRSHVMINSSHNHSGPAMPGYMLDTDEDQTFKERYKRDLLRWLVEAAVEADRQLQPARIGADWGEATLAVYRREYQDGHDVLGEVPGHPIDPSVGVIRVDDLEGSPIAIVFRYSCHPVTIGGRSAVASTDFPGPARDVLERSLGGLAVFLQGCGGVATTLRRAPSSVNPLVTGNPIRICCRA